MTGNPSPRVTLREVAKLAGVHSSLVSKVINNYKDLNIPDSTRDRVLAAVAELNYRPNMAARGLKLSRTFLVGIVIPDLTNPVYSPIVHGAQREASAAGYDIVLGASSLRPEESTVEDSFARLLAEGRVDGVLVASGSAKDSFMTLLAQQRSPVVVVNRRVDGIVASVSLHDAAGAALATKHLINLGHRRLGMIAGPSPVETTHRRIAGFRSALRSVPGYQPGLVMADGTDAHSGHAACEQLLESHPETTAIFAGSLLYGLGALRAANQMGRSVPDDLSIIALHDAEIADLTYPPLTTVAMPLEELGGAAMKLIVSLIEGEPACDLVVEGEGQLMVRGSTAPLKSHD